MSTAHPPLTADPPPSRTQDFARQYQAAYDALNTNQRLAVDTIEGPVLVVAGPGTGKTQVLTMRIANILRQTDTKPSSILALTFTDSAAQNMRLRLAKLIGPDAYYVHISTFHAFCAQLIANHLEYFPLNPSSQPITELERFELLRSIVDDLPLQAVKPLNSPYFHVHSLMTNISAYKREGVAAETLHTLIEDQWQDPATITSRTQRLRVEKKQQQLIEQVRVFEEYQQRLRAAGRYDFDDMLAMAAAVLQREETLLQDYQERFLYLLVDEYQDTNAVQNQVTRLLGSYWGEAANVFAVGDPHQSIYRFQGASLENVVQFVRWYPHARVITLTDGYRCPPLIYAVAHQVIGQDDSLQEVATLGSAGQQLARSLETTLTAVKQVDQSVWIKHCSDTTAELLGLVTQIRTLLDEGTSPNEIAILYPKNKYAATIIPVLDKWHIPYYLEGGIDVLDLLVVQQLLTICLAVMELRQEGGATGNLFQICTYPWFGIDRTTLFQLTRSASKAGQSLHDVIALPWPELHQQVGSGLDEQHVAALKQLVDRLEEWGALDFQTMFVAWLETVIQQSGLHQYLLGRSSVELESLLGIYSLLSFVKQLNTADQQFHLSDFLRAIETLRDQHVAVPLQSVGGSDQKIRLSTVHKAKGQEWEYVFLPAVIDGVWGNRRPPASLPVPETIVETVSTLARQSKEQQNQDDRRLLYVALTRAKKQVTLWHADQAEDNGVVRSQVPSLFLSELDGRADLIRQDLTQTETTPQQLGRLIGPRPSALTDDRLRQYLSQLTQETSFSITAINNYLADPAKYLQQNLLAIPAVKAPHLAFGTAVHAALELIGAQVAKQQAVPPLAKVLQQFADRLQQELLLPQERQRRREHGETVLTAYYQLQPFAQAAVWQTEYTAGYGERATFLADIRLTGRMDRLDWLDADRTQVQVIDYKTGKAKTRNEILVATETARKTLSLREQALPPAIRGPYQRQLLFYKLLAQLDRTFTPTIAQGTFDFVEAGATAGKLVQHTFTLDDQAVRELKELIHTVVAEIRSLQFLEEAGELFH